MALIHFKSTRSDSSSRVKKEDVFLEQYDWMIQSAMNLTRGQRERAEDLVQEAFVQFQIKDQELEDIVDLRAYLYVVLRNIYVSQLRRIARDPIRSVSILDHESLASGLRAYDFSGQFEAMSQLRQACKFACYRKESSVTASIFILRYFHGYYPDEIAKLLGIERSKVDKWLARGRHEAKQYLDEPFVLPPVEKMPVRPSGGEIGNSTDFLRQVRGAIFESCTSPCAETKNGTATLEITIGLANLAHLASCAKCLDRRSKRCGLPGLSEHALEDSFMRDDSNSRPPDSPASAGSRKRRPDTQSKRPKRELLRQIHLRRVQEVVRHVPSEMVIAVDGHVRVSHAIQTGVNIVKLVIDSKERPEFVEVLSGHGVRFLFLDDLDLGCTSRRYYRVPLDGDRLLEVELMPDVYGRCIQVGYISRQPELQTAEPTDSSPDVLPRFRTERSRSTKEEESVLGLWSRIRRRLSLAHMPLRPISAAVVGFVLLSTFFLLWLYRRPNIAPEVSLERAESWDRPASPTAKAGVVYQKIRVRTAKYAFDRSIYRDTQGLRRPKSQKTDTAQDGLRAKLATAGVNWEQPLSAEDYKRWRDHENVQNEIAKPDGQHLIQLTTVVNGGQVGEESLTLRRSDFHAVARTVKFRDSETVEIAELSYEVLPWNRVNDSWFEPIANSAAAATPALSSLPVRLTANQLDEVELKVRWALNQIHADTSERIEIGRGLTGIYVQGIVSTEERKQEIRRQLALIAHVVVAIRSFQELEKTNKVEIPIGTIQQAASEGQRSPLEEYLVPKGFRQDDIREIGHGLFNSSAAVSQEGHALSELERRFVAESITGQGREVLNRLLDAHRERFLASLQAEEQLLEKMGVSVEPARDDSLSVSSLKESADRHVNLCTELLTAGDRTETQIQSTVTELTRSISQLRAAVMRTRDHPTLSQNVP